MEFKKQKNGLSAPIKMDRESLAKAFEAAGYTDPTLITGYGSFYYLCDRDPTPTELDVLDPANDGVGVYVNISDFIYMWVNQTTKEVFWCSDNTFNAMIWHHMASNVNIISMLQRSRSQRSSPAFSTAYQSSTNNDAEINIVINLTAVLGATSSQVDIQFSPDNIDWSSAPITLLKRSSLAIGINDDQLFTITVPTGYYYQIVQTSGTIASIVSINEYK